MKKTLNFLLANMIAVTSFGQEAANLIMRFDGLGSLHSTNKAYSSIYHENKVAEIMAVGPWFPEAVSILQRHYPTPDVGVHLTLTSEWDGIRWRPLTHCPSITDSNGYFYMTTDTLSGNYKEQSLLNHNWNIAEIEKEFRAQIELVLKNIPNASHISGHRQDLTFSKEVTEMAKRLAEEYDLAYLEDEESRAKYNVELITYDGPTKNSVEKKESFSKMLSQLEPGKNYMFIANPALYSEETKSLRHPGYDWMAEDRQGELDAISQSNLSHLKYQKKINLLNYDNLTKSLPRGVPENENVKKEGLESFITTLTDDKQDIHSAMVLRNGKVIFEQWFDHYNSNTSQIMYSVTKTYTATAIGFAVAEKRIKLSDKVISFFPDKLPENVSSNLKAMEIRHLLTMSAGNKPDDFDRKKDDWVKEFLSLPVTEKPGARFAYCNIASYMLSAIIQEVTGEKLRDYLSPRLFRPLGIQVQYWGECAMGVNYGGFDLYIRTEDMAKLGQFMLQKGEWKGKRLLPASWFEEATAKQIETLSPEALKERTSSSDNEGEQGYCYQMWRCTHNSFRADGAYGQFIVVIPDKNAIVAVTAKADGGKILRSIWENIYPAME